MRHSILGVTNRRRLTVDVPIFGREYYISSTGSDSADGLSPATAMSVTAINTVIGSTMRAGDTLLFKKGDSFFNLLTTPLFAKQTISSYGVGANPKIYGSTSLSGATWINEGSGLWSTSIATAPKWVYVNGVSARYGESDWITVTSRPSGTVVRGSSVVLNAYSNLVGAKFRIKEFAFRYSYEFTVTAYNSGTGDLTLDGTVTGTTNQGFKLMGQLQFVTQNGDWFYDSPTQKLYYKSATDPTGTNITTITKDYAFFVDTANNVTIDHVDFSQYYRASIKAKLSTNLSITNCDISDNRTTGVYVYNGMASFNFQNNTLSGHGLNGLEIGGSTTSTVKHNTFHDIGLQANLGFPVDASGKTGGVGVMCLVNELDLSTSLSNNGDWSYNSYYNLGYVAHHLWGANNLIEKNIVHHVMQKWSDGGGLYLIYRNTLSGSTSGNVYQDNIIHDVYGSYEGIVNGGTPYASGIYQDNGCNGNTYQRNTIYNTSFFGILLNFDTKTSTIRNNTITKCGNSEIYYSTDTIGPVWPANIGNILEDNILVSDQPTRRSVTSYTNQTNASYSPFATGGNSDRNNYINPYDTRPNKFDNNGSVGLYTLANWRTLYSMDAASTEMTNYITYTTSANSLIEVMIQANETGSPVSFTPPAGYKDVNGVDLVGSQTIAAYSSLIYLKKIAA